MGFVKSEIKIPYSDDRFTVEVETLESLMGLPIVRFSVRGEEIILTSRTASALGYTLLAAGNEARSDHI